MEDITKDFSRWEFKCKCRCKGCNIDMVSKDLVEGLQAIRDIVGKPVTVTSGVRCEAHNKKVGGAANSFHLRGLAADINVGGMSSEKLAAIAEQVPQFQNGAIITYKGRNFIHVDTRGYKVRLSM